MNDQLYEVQVLAPQLVFVINEMQKEVIDIFADTFKDKDLRTVYKINRIQFTITPIWGKPKCDGDCGMNYCDENGCVDRKRESTHPLAAYPTVDAQKETP